MATRVLSPWGARAASEWLRQPRQTRMAPALHRAACSGESKGPRDAAAACKAATWRWVDDWVVGMVRCGAPGAHRACACMHMHVYRTYMRMCTCMSIAHIVAYAHGTWAGVCTRFARTPAPLTRTHTHSAQPGVRALRLTAPMPSHARVSAPLRRRCAATAGRKERSRRCGARSRTPRAGRSC